MTRCAFARAFCADRSRFMRCCVAGFMPEDRPNSSRDAASVIDAVRAVVLTKPAGKPNAAARSAGGSARRFVEDGGAGAVRGPCTAARNASSWSVSAAARSAASSASLRRRRFFSFFLRLRSRFRFLSFFFSFLRRRLRLRSSLLELLELDDELDELDDEDAIFCAPRLASSAWALMCTAVQSLRCVAHQCGALQLVCALLLLWQTSATPGSAATIDTDDKLDQLQPHREPQRARSRSKPRPRPPPRESSSSS